MNIAGLQKVTLLDYPGLLSCTIFLSGCNMRCPFCHNSLLIDKNYCQISEIEIFNFLKKRQGILDGVCISGGEPLLSQGIDDFIIKIKNLGYKVKLDTNGSNFKKLKTLIEKNLIDYVAMDIKNAPDAYNKTIGLHFYDLKNINESVDFLLSNVIEYEFRTTVVKELHKFEDFIEIGKWIIGAKQYYLQSFILSDNVIDQNLSSYTKEEMEEIRKIILPFVPNAKLRGV